MVTRGDAQLKLDPSLDLVIWIQIVASTSDTCYQTFSAVDSSRNSKAVAERYPARFFFTKGEMCPNWNGFENWIY